MCLQCSEIRTVWRSPKIGKKILGGPNIRNSCDGPRIRDTTRKYAMRVAAIRISIT